MAGNWTERRVVVTGLGVVSPLGSELSTFWDHLVAGECGVDKITSFDASQFDTQIAGQVKDFNPAPAFPSPKAEAEWASHSDPRAVESRRSPVRRHR